MQIINALILKDIDNNEILNNKIKSLLFLVFSHTKTIAKQESLRKFVLPIVNH